jgi:hypothetical protein
MYLLKNSVAAICLNLPRNVMYLKLINEIIDIVNIGE